METVLTLLKANLPFLFSPRFWGVVITSTFAYLRTKGLFDDATLQWLETIAGAATAIGVIGWTAKKLRAK